jgi:hypothetical protein
MTKADLPGSWTIANNDIIRIHGKNWTGTTDTNKTQNNANLWDYKTTSPQDLLDTRYGYVYISNSSTIDGTEGVIDLMTYQNAQENQSHWVADGTSNNAKNLDFLTAQVTTHWNSGVRTGAVTLSDKLTQYLRLKSTVTGDGQSASDWEAYSPPGIGLSDASLTPNSIQAGYSGTPSVTISVKILTYGGVTLNTKTADASSISTGSNNVSLTGPDPNNFYTATVNLDNGKAAGTYNVVINATGTPSSSASLNIPFTVSPGPILAFTNADFEGTFANPFTTVSSSTGPGWHFRTDTFQQGSKSLGFKATLNNAGSVTTETIGLTNPKTYFNSNAGYTYLTFWFKGTVTGDNPALRIQVASGGTVANYYDLNGIAENQVNTLTVKSGGTFPTTPINITNWTKVRLNLTGVNWTPGTDATGHQFTIRIRRGLTSSSHVQTDHDWVIDHIQFEN